MNIRIIATGGTFDKRYDPIAGTLAYGETHLAEILARARVEGSVRFESPMQLDSLEMNDEHRCALLAACRDCAESRIVVIHGTDTMVQTARALGAAALERTIVLTGAMIPYDFTGSDALFNLGFALCAAGTLDRGVYVAMNGRIFPWDAVRKNRALGVFEAA
ncbi:MAG: asparaginase [Burkholderiaceae bacterium]|nr:asparaginase [Burkholderiaceae bacterium]